MKYAFIFASLAIVCLIASCAPDASPRRLAIIPRPQKLIAAADSFAVSTAVKIVLSPNSGDGLEALGGVLRQAVTEAGGPTLEIVSLTAATPAFPQIRLVLEQDVPEGAGEGYRLDISKDGVLLSSRSPAGLFYGIQTIRQLLSAHRTSGGAADPGAVWLPAAVLEDAPRFAYRGMHLDVGRHMFPVAFIKTYIDLLATYKMNTFHWHLTEDQGWRIEIKRYPRLTQIGAFRKETQLLKHNDPYVGDGIPYGGFYSQDEIREVVAYASERFITVIPEIEMPGHATAALAAYPELACAEGPFEVATKWGVHEDIFCPSEETFRFLEGVLTEVMDLFPGRYIHIGGDEAPKTRWEESRIARDVMQREGLADAFELQSYFIRRIETFLLQNGRQLIGWDEILEGGLAPEATVMSWRGVSGGIEAARQGHDVIMTPTDYCYFDYYQGDPEEEPLAWGGFLPLKKVYEFEPVPEVLSADEALHILGAQGNVWTEYIKTPDQVEYMVVPRMLALAEVVWTYRHRRDWSHFVARLRPHLEALGKMGIHYRGLDGTPRSDSVQ